jgi:hypothetical protein
MLSSLVISKKLTQYQLNRFRPFCARVISWLPYQENESILCPVPSHEGVSDLTIYLEFEYFLCPVLTKRCYVDWNPDLQSQPISALPLFLDGGLAEFP